MTDNNKDENLLKVENLDNKQEGIITSVMDVQKPAAEKKTRKINVFTILMSALSHKMANDELYSGIRPVTTLKIAIVAVILSAFLYIFYRFADVKIVIPIIILLCVLIVPALFISFFYEICPKKIVTVFQVFLSFVLGAVLYLTINMLVKSLKIRSIYITTIEVLIVPILWGIGELFLLILLSKIFNLTDQLTGILVAVSIGMGYAFCHILIECVSSLFIPVEVIIDSTTNTHYIGSAIIDDMETFEKSLEKMFARASWYGIYFPVMISGWSVVIGNVISNTVKGEKKDRPFSVYLLVVLVIVFYMLSVFSTSLVTFDIIFKVVSAFFTFYISIKIINNAIVKNIDENNIKIK